MVLNGHVLDESVKNGAELMLGILQLKCARILHETYLVPVFMYGSAKMLWKEKERSRIWAVQMDNLKGLLGIRRIDRVPNAWMKEL